MAASRYAGGDRAASTLQQAFSRCSTMAPQCLLRRVNRLPMIPAWQVMTKKISAFTRDVAHGIRERASELVTLELGHQSEIEVARKLTSEVEAERLIRLDKMLIAEQQDQGVIDLR